jgi:hypothetical protein
MRWRDKWVRKGVIDGRLHCEATGIPKNESRGEELKKRIGMGEYDVCSHRTRKTSSYAVSPVVKILRATVSKEGIHWYGSIQVQIEQSFAPIYDYPPDFCRGTS